MNSEYGERRDLLKSLLLAGIGGAALLAGASSAEATVVFENVLFAAAGSSTRRSEAARWGEIYKNVKDYGAVGNGSNDDASAIQAAVDAAVTVGATVYFPYGIYQIGSTITVTKSGGGDNSIKLVGEAPAQNQGMGSWIRGNVNGFLVKKVDIVGGVNTGDNLRGIEGLGFQNTAPSITNAAGGGCVQWSGNTTGYIDSCSFLSAGGNNVNYCILLNGPPNALSEGDVNNVTVKNCKFQGGYTDGGSDNGSVGVQGGQITIQDCSFQFLGWGARNSSQPVNIFGSRFERNGVGIGLGYDSDGSGAGGGNWVVQGCSLEGNSTGIQVFAGGNILISCCSVRGEGAPVQGQYGLNIVGSVGPMVLENFSVSGSHAISSVFITRATSLTCIGVTLSQSPPGTTWTFPDTGLNSSRNGIQLINCDTTLQITFNELPGGSVGNGITTPLEGMTYDITDCNTSTFLATAASGGSGGTAHRRVRYNAASSIWQVIG
jgi:hypothetical protein